MSRPGSRPGATNEESQQSADMASNPPQASAIWQEFHGIGPQEPSAKAHRPPTGDAMAGSASRPVSRGSKGVAEPALAGGHEELFGIRESRPTEFNPECFSPSSDREPQPGVNVISIDYSNPGGHSVALSDTPRMMLGSPQLTPSVSPSAESGGQRTPARLEDRGPGGGGSRRSSRRHSQRSKLGGAPRVAFAKLERDRGRYKEEPSSPSNNSHNGGNHNHNAFRRPNPSPSSGSRMWGMLGRQESKSSNSNHDLEGPGALPRRRESRTMSGVQKLFSHMMGGPAAGKMASIQSATSDFSDGYERDDEDSEDEEDMHSCQKWCPVLSEFFCATRKEKRRLCYYCFVLVFFGFLLIFPMFFKWLRLSHTPSSFWNRDFPKFPALEDLQFIIDDVGKGYTMNLSDIPSSWHSCNHSCVGASPHAGLTGETSFPVNVHLDAPDFQHTAYPVLFASNDFHTWWVAADRGDSTSTPFFSSHLDETSQLYQHVTESCTRPPPVTQQFQEYRETVSVQDGYGSVPLYVLVCVAWEWDSIEWHGNRTDMTSDDIAQHCQAVGGACGWPCGSNPSVTSMPGCDNGVINVDTAAETLAGVALGGADFSGEVSLRACHSDPTSEDCFTYSSRMSDWPCHKCSITSVMHDVQLFPDDPTSIGNKSFKLLYDSLPRMEILLQNVALELTDAVPHAYVLTSTVDPQLRGPAGLYGGSWRKAYNEYNMIVSDPYRYPPPSVVQASPAAAPEPDQFTPAPTAFDPEAYYKQLTLLDFTQKKMEYMNKRKLTLDPEACFATRGPLYLVACAVNESTYASGFRLQNGQSVAPPPFNDRCLAVTGKCGYACMDSGAHTPAMEHCDATTGQIPMDELFDGFELPTNDGAVVFFFMMCMTFGFSVKLMVYMPGLFTPDKHPSHYHPMQTNLFKYIAVVTPSGGESKACVLRNIVGAVSALPVMCRCPYHVVYADEGHRFPQKIMFRAFAAVLDAVPQGKVVRMGGRIRHQSSSHNKDLTETLWRYKEENLKTLTKEWVEQTRQFTLKDCETGKMSEKIKRLTEKDQEPDEVKKMKNKIDSLCGLNALRRLQSAHGWPKAAECHQIAMLEEKIMKLREELAMPEQEAANPKPGEHPRPLQADDVETVYWQPMMDEHDGKSSKGPTVNHFGTSNDWMRRLYTLHYVARAKPAEDERTLKVQHVARGMWYYRLPKEEEKRDEKTWLDWRAKARVYRDGDDHNQHYLVPIRTSRGKAGGLNFVENYLFDYIHGEECKLDPVLRHSLFSIADARHQFQPDFFHETIPFFVKPNQKEIDIRIAFTQSPQYFPEMNDEVDYLDTNNANFFRMNCLLRNCCGGVSSCGTNGTWLVRDRRAGASGCDSVWEEESKVRMEFTEKVERRFFHESCKVEDTASSLDRVVRGRMSAYVNRRLSYGMAKDPTDYLAAVQRWAEGGVVLSLQTFLGLREGIHMVWMTAFFFMLFTFSLINSTYGWGYTCLLSAVSMGVTGGDYLQGLIEDVADWCADLVQAKGLAQPWERDVYYTVFVEVETWLVLLLAFVLLLALITTLSHYIHHPPCCPSRRVKRTVFPTSMAQWARLAISFDNLSYFLWFWTAFFWVFFNYQSVWGVMPYRFEAKGMVLFSYLAQVLGWSLVIVSTARHRAEQGASANEVFFLSLTNIWRSTQLYYITAPLILYSIVMGISDFLRNRMLDVDISYWVGGDRGAVSKSIAQWWTLLLCFGAVLSHICYWAGALPNAEPGGLLIVTFIGLDVMHPCAFLWMGSKAEKGPPDPPATLPSWQRCPLRLFYTLTSLAFYRNCLRAVIFHPRTAGIVKWIGPVQNLVFPVLTWFIPEFGVSQALLLLASSRN